ncbi:MAG TPA: cytochrome c-type biogenesis protein [Alphaproteobacteria bacterium]|nr:cytochrome c-type biogenesis protein [Alphaproteobacteria bacterium]
MLIIILALLLAAPAFAVDPGERLDDPALEARARDISAELRCLVCQNQSIDDSNAPLARDLRILVRERLKAGDSDREAIAYITARYGDYVLLKPPFRGDTLLLWLGPTALLLLAAAAVAVLAWRRRAIGREAPPLSEAEERRLAALLADREERT